MTFSRRDFIVGAGASASAVAVPGMALPGAADAAVVRRVALAPEARDAIDVIGTILQDGPDLTGFGWLTHVAGLSAADLFTDPAHRNAGTARFRWHAQVHVGSIDLLGNIFFGIGRGRMRIFFAANGGAQDGKPNTFASGRLVARYAGRFRNVQTVIAPDHAITEITGELSQRVAQRFVVRGRHRQFGRANQLSRLHATGFAIRTNATIPRSTRYVAGGITIPS